MLLLLLANVSRLRKLAEWYNRKERWRPAFYPTIGVISAPLVGLAGAEVGYLVAGPNISAAAFVIATVSTLILGAYYEIKTGHAEAYVTEGVVRVKYKIPVTFKPGAFIGWKTGETVDEPVK